MIRNINYDLLKKAKMKLCAVGVGIVLSMNLAGCEAVNENVDIKDTNSVSNITAEDMLDEDVSQASINVNFSNADLLEKRDIIVFVTQESREIYGAVKTNGNIFTTNLPVGEYYICSGVLEPVEFKVEDASQNFTIDIDYLDKSFEIKEDVKENSHLR